MIKLTVETIEETTSRRLLLAQAYQLEATTKAGGMTPDEYTACSLALAKKLGFGITEDNLSRAAEDLAIGDKARDTRKRNDI